NLGKRQHPALSLAIIATWVNALNHGDFKTSRAEMCWAFNAATNMAIARQVFHCFGYHKDQIQDWATWDIMKQSEVLDALRTGSLTAKLRCEVAARGQASLFKIVSRGLSVQSGIDYANMLETMVRIAAKYSLTPEEFDYYCCTDSPYDTRVFYPFHVLSRSQAKAIGWSWDLLTAFASERLARMRTQCNKLAEEAGCGEKVVTDVYLAYWMAHWICQKIQTVKKQRPDASQDEIAFRLGDRWGSWMHHIWCASLCKLQDHGIAMFLGVVVEDGKEWDPVEGFDFGKCTVTIDTGFTNFAMYRFPPDSWERIRTIVSMVPLHHPLWRPDPDLGMAIWNGAYDGRSTPRPPTPLFDMPLLPLKLWIPGHEEDFVTAGLRGIGGSNVFVAEEELWSAYGGWEIPA
ncbi:hypothetical protein BR93DRAFT_990466, partial [Coniochaeta sp. PMI_546]